MAEIGRPTIVSGLVARLVATAVACGLDRDAFLAELGLEPTRLEDRDGRLPVDTFARAWQLMATRLPGRVLALDWITSWKITDAGLLGFLLLQLRTVEEALLTATRYAHLVNQAARARLHKGSPSSRVAFELPPALLATQLPEAMLAGMVLQLRNAIDSSLRPIAVRFPYRATDRTPALERYFGAPVLHEAGEVSVELPTEILGRPLPNADPVLAGYPAAKARRRRGHLQRSARGGAPDVRHVVPGRPQARRLRGVVPARVLGAGDILPGLQAVDGEDAAAVPRDGPERLTEEPRWRFSGARTRCAAAPP